MAYKPAGLQIKVIVAGTFLAILSGGSSPALAVERAISLASRLSAAETVFSGLGYKRAEILKSHAKTKKLFKISEDELEEVINADQVALVGFRQNQKIARFDFELAGPDPVTWATGPIWGPRRLDLVW